MNQNEKISVMFSWPVIIIAFIFFWPVGVALLIGRVSKDKKTAMSVGKIVNGLGIASYVIAAIGTLSCLSAGITGEDVGMILFFAIAGVVLQRVGKKMKNDAENVRRYLAIIVNGNETRIDNIAAAVGKSYDVSKADIQKMIDKGYLKDAYINEITGEIVLPNRIADIVTNVTEKIETEVQPRVVVCKCCGAQNTLSSATGECEYCGSPIS
ncbi:MAG: hypothetical protein IJZ53_10785 [Tyzzerella sp.]|nr:hypothetical protein [Tyzzerella sp.]